MDVRGGDAIATGPIGPATITLGTATAALVSRVSTTPAAIRVYLNGNPQRVPKPSRDGLARATLMGTLKGFPNPPATGSHERL